MTEIILGVLLSVWLPVCVCLYYAGDAMRAEKGALAKGKAVFKRTAKEYTILALTFLVCALTFVLNRYFYLQSDIFWTCRWQIAVGMLLPIAVIDYKEYRIPNKLLLIGFALGALALAAQVLSASEYILPLLGGSLIGALVGGGIFLVASLFVKNGVGAGDIKMFLCLGFLLGFRGIFNVLLYSMVVSAVFSVILLILKKKTVKDELPLAPFALIGTAVAILLGV